MKKKLIFKGPLLTRSGYGEQSRFAIRALRDKEDLFDIYIQPLTWGQTSWIGEDTEEIRWINQMIEKTILYMQSGGQFDVSFQVTIPNEWTAMAPINIGYTAGIETTKVAHQWIQKGNEMNGIIVVSHHSKNVYEHTQYQAVNDQTGQEVVLKLERPIKTVNYPAKKFETLPEVNLELEHDVNFLAAAQLSPRKNMINTIKWFIEEFKDDEVGLVLKGNTAKNCLMDREHTLGNIRAITQQFPDRKCKVYLLHGDMSDEEMHSLQVHPQVSALISLAHGEGFGLPIFEAAYSGTPVIATGWSGQLDFLIDEEGKQNFYNVGFDLGPVQDEVVWDGVIVPDSMWAYAREQSAKEQMRLCYEDVQSQNKDSVALNSCAFAETVQERFAQEKQYKAMVDAVLEYMGVSDEDEWQDILEQVVEYD